MLRSMCKKKETLGVIDNMKNSRYLAHISRLCEIKVLPKVEVLSELVEVLAELVEAWVFLSIVFQKRFIVLESLLYLLNKR